MSTGGVNMGSQLSASLASRLPLGFATSRLLCVGADSLYPCVEIGRVYGNGHVKWPKLRLSLISFRGTRVTSLEGQAAKAFEFLYESC